MFAVDLWQKIRALQNKADSWDKSRRETADLLYALAKELDNFQREIEDKKRKLSMAGMVGGGLTLIGVGLSFVTAGASLGLAGVGMTLTGTGCGIASGLGGFYQQREENKKNKEIVAKADAAVKMFRELSEQFVESLRELQEMAKERDIHLEFTIARRELVKVTTGVVVCSGTMMSALAGLGLLAANTGRAAAQAVNTGSLSVVSLVGNAVKYIGVTDRLSRFATGVASMRGLVTTACDVAGSGMNLVNAAGKIARVAGSGLAVLSVGLDFKAYVDASVKMAADKPSTVAERIRNMADELENISR